MWPILIILLGLLTLLPGSGGEKMQAGSNRLGLEKSPYLLQHKDNPVHWFAWGSEAFEAAKRENKPIFLSIGYSTCYWCHMMEKDSFELPEVADALNKDFISIKVDREEHPDVDQIYMDAVIGITGRGGWPMSVFLTPDLKPIFGGTFFWRQQFLDLLSRISRSWKEEPDKIFAATQEVMNYLADRNKESGAGKLSEDLLRSAFHQYEESFDSRHGGFGGAPKFPPSVALSLLLRIHRRTGNQPALQMATQTLDAMARGGIYDKIGGGFHRYATQDDWNEPHYEKMLYDNALMATTYLEAYQVMKAIEEEKKTSPEGALRGRLDPALPVEGATRASSKTYAEVARETLDYVLREMTDPEGGFYSAQDAGEVGKEGEYYHLNKEERAKHLPPHKDDKILTSWNGLMIAAMAKGYQVLGDECYLTAAQKSASFIERKLHSSGRLLRRYRDGDSRYDGTLDDYAFLIHGLLALYESDFDPKWIRWAEELQRKQDELFWDSTNGGYFFSPADDKTLLVRKKETHDGAIPSGNSVAALNLLRLFGLTFRMECHEKGERLLPILAGEATRYPSGFAQALIALDYRLDRSKEIAVAGSLAETKELIREIWRRFLPNKVLAVGLPVEGLSSPIPLLNGKKLIGGKSTIYVCENLTCKRPTTDLGEAIKLIDDVEKYKM
jgi:hypothetical protein